MSSDIFDVDQLQLYFGKDYVINDQIKIKQATIAIKVLILPNIYPSLSLSGKG